MTAAPIRSGCECAAIDASRAYAMRAPSWRNYLVTLEYWLPFWLNLGRNDEKYYSFRRVQT